MKSERRHRRDGVSHRKKVDIAEKPVDTVTF
jgi:hypothetical protein